MNDVVIRVENLGKRYRIGARQKADRTFRETLMDIAASPFRRLQKMGKAASPEETIWALKDVCLEVRRGEVLGIIGRNGAGKSTLLKILSRITEPTEGSVEIRGRVASLLEVGTGFHPELTGRENIFLNGAVLGMTRKEIQRKFDEIVAFSEIEKFIDTPVKRYSSGMYVRLAFAVAAHLEPEILLVDEVLAVGDVAFQKKCLGKMDEVSRAGRTVLFVSHNMGAVQNLCQRGILLQDGGIGADCTVGEAVRRYLRRLEEAVVQRVSERTDRRGRGQVRLVGVEISNGVNSPSASLATGGAARFVFHLSSFVPGTSCTFTVYDHLGQAITNFNSSVRGPQDSRDPSIGPKFVCDVHELLILPGRYRVNVAIFGDNELQDHIEGAALFNVDGGQIAGRPVAQGRAYGTVSLHHRWTLPGQ